MKIANTLTAWPQETGSLPDGAPLLPPAVILSGVASNAICSPFQERCFASAPGAPGDLFLSRSIGIWRQHLFSSHHHALCPRLVPLRALVNELTLWRKKGFFEISIPAKRAENTPAVISPAHRMQRVCRRTHLSAAWKILPGTTSDQLSFISLVLFPGYMPLSG